MGCLDGMVPKQVCSSVAYLNLRCQMSHWNEISCNFRLKSTRFQFLTWFDHSIFRKNYSEKKTRIFKFWREVWKNIHLHTLHKPAGILSTNLSAWPDVNRCKSYPKKYKILQTDGWKSSQEHNNDCIIFFVKMGWFFIKCEGEEKHNYSLLWK